MKVFVLVALAAIVAGCTAAPAMADKTIVLCKVNAGTCKAEDQAGEEFTAEGVSTLFFSGLGSVECTTTVSRSKAEQLSALSFTGCSGGCSVEASSLPYRAELVEPSAGNGVIGISDSGSGEPKFTLECGTTECVYGLGSPKAEFEGGEPAALFVSRSITEKTGSFFCPKTGTWEASYELTSPSSAVFMASRAVEGPVFCGKNVGTCPQKDIVGSLYAELEPEKTFRVNKLVGGAISCSQSGFALLDNIDPFAPGPWRYKPFGISKCTHPTYTSCTLNQENISYYAYLLPSGGGNGEVSVAMGDSKKDPALRIECTSGKTPFKCIYSTEEFWLLVEGGEPTKLEEIGSMTRVEGSGTFCPANVLVQAEHEAVPTVVTPNLYLTES